MTANCQIPVKDNVKTALGRPCRAGIWHNAERVNRGYDVLEFGDFIESRLVKQERTLKDNVEEGDV